jgi:hypothetical protein
MRFLAIVVLSFHIVIINGGHFVTTTIMHSMIFKPETMDNSAATSGRHGYKCLPNHMQNPRSSCDHGTIILVVSVITTVVTNFTILLRLSRAR